MIMEFVTSGDEMRKMQDICTKALHGYREASDALNKLETKKKMI